GAPRGAEGAMRLTVDVGGEDRVFQVEEAGDVLRVHDGERWHEVRLDGFRRSVRCATLDDRRMSFGWRRVDDAYEVLLDGITYSVRVRDGRFEHLRKVTRGPAVHDGETLVRAPIPGLVVAVKVKPGDEVKKGQCLLVLAAMKLENEISAPRDGTVGAVAARAGAPVEKGATLVTLAM
ncbi:MAG: biotin/lipoyl-containing protein, partial [Planctomycetota bacterium]